MCQCEWNSCFEEQKIGCSKDWAEIYSKASVVIEQHVSLRRTISLFTLVLNVSNDLPAGQNSGVLV